MPILKEGVYPFVSGSHYGEWNCFNYDECRKGWTEEMWWQCDIERACDEAYLGHGYVSEGIALRMAYPGKACIFRCGEFISKGSDGDGEWPPFPDPNNGGYIEAGQQDLSMLWSLPEIEEPVSANKTSGAITVTGLKNTFIGRQR